MPRVVVALPCLGVFGVLVLLANKKAITQLLKSETAIISAKFGLAYGP